VIKRVSSLSEAGVKSTSRILFAFAHPDDESVFAVGFVQQALKLGAALRLITLTHGEAGSTRYGLRSGDDLGAVRSMELQNACRILGSFSCQALDFPDGGLSCHLHEIQEALGAESAQFQPDYLLSFAPDGITGHSDHQAASQAVTQLHRANPGLFQLIYATGHRNHSRPGTKGMELVLTLAPEQSHRKVQALEAHRSQFTSRSIHAWFSSDRMDVEHFFLPF
jgi:LmbE family N-acetylglucosaminyl deacetylase